MADKTKTPEATQDSVYDDDFFGDQEGGAMNTNLKMDPDFNPDTDDPLEALSGLYEERSEPAKETKEETKNQCRDVPETVCQDFTTQKCETHQTPVQETQYNEECYTKIKQVKFTFNFLD